MTKSKPVKDNSKPSIQVTRTRVSGKKRMDLFANLRNTEHPLDNILPDPNAVIPSAPPEAEAPLKISESDVPVKKSKGNSRTGITGTTSIANTTDTSGITGITNTTGITTHPTSPVRDFTKTPNSVTRIILAQGLFRGKSKQIYDYFWSVSRGAIKPVRTFRKTHREIQKGAGIGSRNTVIDGLRHLQSIGLIKFVSSVGVAGGNEYEIFTPDELGYTGISGITDTTGTPDSSGISQLYRNLDIPVQPDSGITGTTQTADNKDTYSLVKTSLKTIENIDDESPSPLDLLARKLGELSLKHTGKNLSLSEREKWGELAELLAGEFELAAARASSISSVPAFLTEHLRRRLLIKPVNSKRGISKSLEVGKPVENSADSEDMEKYEAEPLSEEGREAVLKTIQGFLDKGQADYVAGLEQTYTPEDWSWLMSRFNKT